MRSTIINFLAAALVVFGTTAAGALSWTVSQVGTTCTGDCEVGDTVDLELTIDASDLIADSFPTFGYGVSLLITGDAVWGTVLVVDGGVGLQNTNQFQVDAGTFGIVGGLAFAGQEPQNTINPTIVVMASFFSGLDPAESPSLDYGNAFDGNFVARVTLELLTAGLDAATFIAAGAGTGDVFDYNDVDIMGDFTSNSLEIGTVPIPEPGTALLMALGLVGLSAAGSRRKA